MKTISANIIIFFILSLWSCDTKTSNNNNETSAKNNDSALIITEETKTNSKEKILADSVIWRLTKIANGDYSLKVESFYLDDDVLLSNDVIDNVVLKQEVFFYYKDSLLNKLVLPVKALNVKTEKRKVITIQENNISSLAIVNGKKGWFYKIAGAGVLGTQSEFYGAYSPEGNALWFSYATFHSLKKENKDYPNEHFGDLDKILKEYEVKQQEFNKPITIVDIGLFK